MNCNSCGDQLVSLIYEGEGDKSITTMNTYLNGRLKVYLCSTCGHCQTSPLNDLKSYYETDYELGRLNEDDDQLYAMSEDGPIYRANHQASILLKKYNLHSKTKLLDFGCGKSLTMKNVCSIIDGFKPYVYDVADRYENLWLAITDKERCAVNKIPEQWYGSFDIVTSFYALEHIEDLHSICTQIRDLLNDNGFFYFIVPDMLSNPADFIVADHVNHFSKSSIAALMKSVGFKIVEIDSQSHVGAVICLAQKLNEINLQNPGFFINGSDNALVRDENFVQKAHGLSEFWKSQNAKLSKKISDLPNNFGIAIYGAGFYGSYLHAVAMQAGKNIEYFVDSNPHISGYKCNGIPIVAPSQIPSSVRTILVGLNPKNAKSTIQSMKDLEDGSFSFIFIE